MPQRRLPRDARRRTIEDAASELMAVNGYAATRLKDIAAAAGVTKQLLYRHFPSKKALQMALLARHRDELLTQLAQGMRSDGSLLERVRRTAEAWFAYVEGHPYASAMLFRDTSGDPELQAFYAELQSSARAANAALLRAEPNLGLPESQLEPLAEFIRAGIVGLALWWADHPEIERAAIVDVAVRMVAGGLGLVDRRTISARCPTAPRP
jgi:AcrR family transcriptional regulator